MFLVFLVLFQRRQWHPTPVLLSGKSHGQRSLISCSPWGRKESDMTERLHFHFSLSCIGDRIGNPLQCSCLEYPRDGGAWWATIYGVSQSRIWLKQLSSSSSNLLFISSFISFISFHLITLGFVPVYLISLYGRLLLLLLLQSRFSHVRLCVTP